MNICPFVWSGGSMELKDFENLVYFWVPIEHRFLFNKFSKNASDCPDINSQTVLFLSKKNLWGSVPKGFYFMSERLDGYSESSCKSKVGNLKISVPINKEILGFQIPMNYSSRMAIVHTVHQLVQEQFHLVGSNCCLVLRKILFQIVVQKFENEI